MSQPEKFDAIGGSVSRANSHTSLRLKRGAYCLPRGKKSGRRPNHHARPHHTTIREARTVLHATAAPSTPHRQR